MTTSVSSFVSSHDDVADGVGLSDYEVVRAKNIERNNAKLLELGLITRREQLQSNAVAWKRRFVSQASDGAAKEVDDLGVDASKKKRKREPLTDKQPELSTRKSLRLQGIEPVLSNQSGCGVHVDRQMRVKECREARQRAAIEYAELGLVKAAKENPTATYDHCLMRVRTMSDQALQNRVKAIERAAGKHSVVKMAIFKSCLQDESKWDLAELARQALERLKALLPPPE